MENFVPFTLLLIPGLITTVVVSLNAKKTNAQWRERRAAKLAARAASAL